MTEAPFSISVILLLAALGAGRQAQSVEAPDPRVLVERAIERDRYGLSPPRDFTFKFRQEEQRTDKQGQVVSRGAKTYEVLTLYGELVEHCIARDDHPLSGEEAAREERRYQKIVNQLSRRSEQQRAADNERARQKVEKDKAFLHEIPEVYDLAFAGEEVLGQRRAYKIIATPRKQAKIHTRGPQGNLLRLPGIVWIDEKDGQWVKVEAEAPESLRFGLFLAVIKPGSRVSFEQQRVDENVWLPLRVSGRLSARVLGLPLNLQNTTTYFDYRKFRSEIRILDPAERQ